MWDKIVEKQLMRHSQKFLIERKKEAEALQKPDQAMKPKDTGFLDFSKLQPSQNPNVEPGKKTETFDLKAVKLNSKDRLMHSDIGSSNQSSLRLMTLKSFSENLPLRQTDIVFEGAILQDTQITGGTRYVIKDVMKPLKYKTTELLCYMIEEAA